MVIILVEAQLCRSARLSVRRGLIHPVWVCFLVPAEQMMQSGLIEVSVMGGRRTRRVSLEGCRGRHLSYCGNAQGLQSRVAGMVVLIWAALVITRQLLLTNAGQIQSSCCKNVDRLHDRSRPGLLFDESATAMR